MKQETTNKFAEILAAAQAKANQKATPKFSAPAPEAIKPPIQDTTPEEVHEVAPMPELSTMTSASLLNADLCAPSFFDMIKPYALPKPEEKPALQIVDYSPKSFAILTAAKPEEEILNILRQHGTYNQFLKCGKGWIFSKRHLQTVKDKLGL